MKTRNILALGVAVGLATLVGGCDNKCPINQTEMPLQLTRHGTSRSGIDYDLYHSEQLPGSYLDYRCDGVVDIIFPVFDIRYTREDQGAEKLFEDADRELALYKERIEKQRKVSGYQDSF